MQLIKAFIAWSMETVLVIKVCYACYNYGDCESKPFIYVAHAQVVECGSYNILIEITN